MTLNEIMMSLEMGLIYGVIALGVYLTFRIIDFPDLTCDGSFVFGVAVSSMLIKSGASPWIALIGAIGAGCSAGIATGVLCSYLKITDLLSGILVSFMLYSINLHVMGGLPNISLIGFSTVFDSMGTLGVLSLICFALVLCGSCLLMTDFGLALRAVGQNKRLAQNYGISLKRMTLVGLAISNGLIALGGALFSQSQGFADVGSGLGTVIVGLASVMIGERILPCRSMWVQVLSCILGSVVYRVLISLALYGDVLGLQTSDLNLITGLMIVVIMAMPRRRSC